MVIDNIRKKEKISETIYKYVQVCYLLPTDYKLIFWTSGRWAPFTSMHCCKPVWKLPYTRLRRSLTIAVTSSTVACLSSWIVIIRLRNTRSFRNPHRKKSGRVRSGDRAGQAMSPKLRTQVTRCCAFQRSIATDHMKWRPLLYRSSSRQLRQLSRRRNIQIWNVSVGSAPICILQPTTTSRWKFTTCTYTVIILCIVFLYIHFCDLKMAYSGRNMSSSAQ